MQAHRQSEPDQREISKHGPGTAPSQGRNNETKSTFVGILGSPSNSSDLGCLMRARANDLEALPDETLGWAATAETDVPQCLMRASTVWLRLRPTDVRTVLVILQSRPLCLLARGLTTGRPHDGDGRSQGGRVFRHYAEAYVDRQGGNHPK